MSASVRESLRDRFGELAAEAGIDTSAVTVEPSSRGYLRIDGPGIEPTEIWGNSGVRDVVDALASGSDPADEGAARNAAEGRAADRREDVETIQSIEAVGPGGGSPDPDAYAALAGIDEGSDRLFISNVNGRLSLSAYETADRENRVGSVVIDEDAIPNAPTRLLNSLRDLGPEAARAAAAGVETDAELAEAAADREARRETREAAEDAAAAAGVDLDEFGIGATAEGDVIVQDRDSGRTRRIDADAPGGVGSAINAATGDGQFAADSADPAAGTSGSGDGLGARAAGAVVLLFGALAAALGWLS
jgi:hypothetical protein